MSHRKENTQTSRNIGFDLVGVWETAELFGVSRQRIHQLAREHPDFLWPAAELKAGKIWLRRDLEEWARR